MIKLLLALAIAIPMLSLTGCSKPEKNTTIQIVGNTGNTQQGTGNTQNNQVDNSVENPEPIVE